MDGIRYRLRAWRYRWLPALDAATALLFLIGVNAGSRASSIPERWIAVLPAAGLLTLTQALVFEAGRPYRAQRWREVWLAVGIHLLALFPLVADLAFFVYTGLFEGLFNLEPDILAGLFLLAHLPWCIAWVSTGTVSVRKFGTKRNVTAFQYTASALIIVSYLGAGITGSSGASYAMIPLFLTTAAMVGIAHWRFLEPAPTGPGETPRRADAPPSFRRAV